MKTIVKRMCIIEYLFSNVNRFLLGKNNGNKQINRLPLHFKKPKANNSIRDHKKRIAFSELSHFNLSANDSSLFLFNGRF